MCTYTERKFRACRAGHTYMERAKCNEAKQGDFWHPRRQHMHMPGNIVSGLAIKCPHCNSLHFELGQDNDLDAADGNDDGEDE